MTLKNIGGQIKKRRRFLKIRQSDLAEIAGVSLRSLKAIEKGDGNPGINQINKILNVLGLRIAIEERLNEI